MPAGRQKQPVSKIVIDLTRNDEELQNFCEYYRSEHGRKKGDPKKNKNGEIIEGEFIQSNVDGDYAKYLKGILSYAIEAGSVPDTFVEHAENAVAWKAAKGGGDALKSQIQLKAKSDPEVAKALETLKKKGLV